MKLVKVVSGTYAGTIGFVKDVYCNVVTLIPLVDKYKPPLLKLSIINIRPIGGM